MSVSAFSSAHRLYVKSLYRRFLKNSLDWTVRRDLWRAEAMEIRAEFESYRNVHDPRSLAAILEAAEARLAAVKHCDPVISPMFPGGTKWERNLPPDMAPVYDHMAHADEAHEEPHEAVEVEVDPQGYEPLGRHE